MTDSLCSSHFSSCYWGLLQDDPWPHFPHSYDDQDSKTCFCLNLNLDLLVLPKFCDKLKTHKAEGAKLWTQDGSKFQSNFALHYYFLQG